MHDAVAVRVLEGAAGLLEDADRFLEAQGAGLLEDLAEGAALDALHRVPEEGAGGADAVDGDDVGVIERGGDLGLALEALGGVGAVGELQRQDLERDGAVELDFVGEVDERHAAAAEELVDLELAAQVALQGALQLFGHGRLGRLVGDEGAAAVGAHDRVTGDVAGVAAGADHACKLRHMEVRVGGEQEAARVQVDVTTDGHPPTAPVGLVAGAGVPMVVGAKH